ncbi:MAG TPA: MFS transporter [Firmicutes bacterium]|nr:MFS transporter [Bacillota bacterium]
MRPSFAFLILLGIGHLLTDVNQGAIPALLPYLRDEYGLSYTVVGSLLMVSNITSSVIQPLFGFYSDRSHRRWLLPLGILLAGTGVALAGQVKHLGLLYLAVALSGLGIASYHPEASRITRYLAGNRRATGMSLYSIGGNVGFALGPVLLTLALGVGGGMRGTALFLLPAVAGSLLFLALLPAIGSRERVMAERVARAAAQGELPNCWGAEILLLAIVMLRSLFQFGMITFLPFYFVEVIGGTREGASNLLFVFLAMGALGTLLGGPLADRLGPKTVLVGSLGLVIPFHILLLAVGGSLTFPLVAVIGLALVSTFSVSLVMSQQYLPRHVGTASGLNIGLSIGLGGVGAAVLGAVADRWGIPTTLWLLTCFPLLGMLLGLVLPSPTEERPTEDRQPGRVNL